MVQGVGYRFFTQHAAERLGLGGYVKNLADGRVEVFAVGTPPQLAEFRSILAQGPRFSSVSEVREETASLDSAMAHGFEISY
jgi:acylphosphatase